MLKETKRKSVFNWEVISLLTKINTLKLKFWSAFDMHVAAKSEMDREMNIEDWCCSLHFRSLVYISGVWDQHFQELFIDLSESNYVRICLLKYNAACSASLSFETWNHFSNFNRKVLTPILNLEKIILTLNSTDLWNDPLMQMVDALAKKLDILQLQLKVVYI